MRTYLSFPVNNQRLTVKHSISGFTLIELLVVIAIIGILSAIVLAQLNTARDKGGDAAVKANLANLRSQAALYSDENGSSYGTPGTSCATAGSVFVDGRVAEQIVGAQNASGGGSVASCANSATKFVVSVPLRTDKTKQWCVDDSGSAKEGSADTTGIKCP
jgi:prepilin-type N-terminal cleavage/methylation domain-containing protein